GKSVEQVAAESGVPMSKVRAVLPALELDGFSERCETGWRRVKR
ncbi:MAG: DNA-processing protein DprA, partial [Haloechinothrix sp.]